MMPALLVYEGKAAVALAVFWLSWRLLLKKETLHRLNRAVLTGAMAFSFLFPLCVVTIRKPAEAVPAALPDPMLPGLAAPLPAAGTPWWQTALLIMFWTGVALSLLRVAVSILSIARIIRRGERIREEGCTIVITERDTDPFSWMRWIVLSRKDMESGHDAILAHEKAHVACGHSAELLAVHLLAAFQWFNPVAWMLCADLQELHEYEADDAVLRGGADLREYQYLLIRKAVGKSGYSVANSFNHSILKNRITMMSKSKSPLSRGLRALYLLPLIATGVCLQARTIYVPTDKVSEKIVPADTLRATGVGLDTMPGFEGGDLSAFRKWVAFQVQYPKSAKDGKVQGSVLVRFTIAESGEMTDVRVLKGVAPELDAEAVRVVSSSPRWTPGTQDGKPVAVTLVVPITFSLTSGMQKADTAHAGAK